MRPLTCVTCGSYSTFNGTVTSQWSRTMFWKQELATGVGSYQFSVFTELCIFYPALVTHCFMYPLRGRIYTDELHYLKYRIQWVLIVVKCEWNHHHDLDKLPSPLMIPRASLRSPPPGCPVPGNQRFAFTSLSIRVHLPWFLCKQNTFYLRK